MKYFLFLAMIFIASCDTKDKTTGKINADTIQGNRTVNDLLTDSTKTITPAVTDSLAKTYSNKRFRDVSVERQGEHKYIVSGKAQIFEANFSWIIEDGHNELKKGFAMTDAGAPEWGNFRFLINVKKERENSALTLILFEPSAKDGSAQHQLFIPI